MEKCKTCKHWDNPEGEYGEVPGVGKCKAVVQFWNATEWNDDGDKRSLKPEYTGKLAFVQDKSDYYAELNTLPDFGCVQHENISAADFIDAAFEQAKDKIFLLTTGSGDDGDEWNVESIHATSAGAVHAKEEYERPRSRGDGSTYSLTASIEEWKLQE